MRALLLTLLLLLPLPVLAGSITYTGDCSDGCATGEDHDAANMNEIKTEVDDNDGRITTVEAHVSSPGHFSPNANPATDHSSYVAGHGDGANCSAGSYPLGVDAAGAVTGCTDATTEIDAAIDAEFQASTLDWLTTGTITGGVDVIATTGTSLAMTADQARGSFHTASNTGVVTFTLPAAASGLSACFYDLDATSIVTVDVQVGDVISLDGVALAAGDSIDSAGARGDFVCLIALDTTNWLTLGRSGTWVDGN